MADKKLRFSLLTKFKKNLNAMGKDQDINIYAQQWAADAMIESYGYDKCVDIINYYFKVAESPDWTWLSYNSEKVLQSMKLEQEDLELRAKLREGAKRWLEK